ncbi:MAG: protein-L-isoaspartate(D-aspartate) O-methyltransferase [Saprospiraceae bacterium]|nr:protein-L-isoaspartate(D-aspartate) O-methyltransferase [Saprospiraceae bacterium]
MEYIDNYRHKGLRKKLVDSLRAHKLFDEKILKAIADIPRHFFLDPAFADWAYKDIAFPIDAEQTISQPYTVAFQTQLLDVKPKDKILEIGTGSGYQAAVLHYLGAKVYTIERHEKLFHKTTVLLIEIGFEGVRTFLGDGYKGLPRYAPFDKIIVTAGAEEIPSELVKQLRPGGIMVIPQGQGEDKDMVKLTKIDDKNIKREKLGKFRFVPFISGISK